MHLFHFLYFSVPLLALTIPTIHDPTHNFTYIGIITSSDVEAFLGIPYGFAPERFSPPQPFSPPVGHIFNSTAPGHACPQAPDAELDPESLITNISEDCLNLNVVRPVGAGTKVGPLPVMVWIYGGGLNSGSASARTTAPDGLIRQSVKSGSPIIYVAMNYRLNIFGFATSEALRDSKSLNNGLRDQRLALEWVQSNIAAFGGDPSRVTIFGQSSGGLSVGMQVLAYGGSQPVPFSSGILESSSLEPGSTSPITFNATASIAVLAGCLNASDTSSSSPLYPFSFAPRSPSQSPSVISCLQALPMPLLLNYTATFVAETGAISNTGDIFLPTIDQDFLPSSPSNLVAMGQFAKVPLVLGWEEEDGTLLTPFFISTPEDTAIFIQTFWPGLSNGSVSKLLELYPTSDFPPPAPSANSTPSFTAEFFRSARIFRDILFVCPSLLFGKAMALKYSSDNSNINARESTTSPIYLFTNNQTILTNYLSASFDPVFGPGAGAALGVIHGSELPYVYGDLQLYNLTNLGILFQPTEKDEKLAEEVPRSFAEFAWKGELNGSRGALKKWNSAFEKKDGGLEVFVIGADDQKEEDVFTSEKLEERCRFLNSKEVIAELAY